MRRFAMADLFEPLDVTGPDLLLREFGRKARDILEERLLEVPSGEALVLDFEAVSVVDLSFADETLVELAAGLTEGRYGDRYFVLESPSEATIENLEGAVARRRARVKLAFLVRDKQGVRVIGHIEPNLVEAWRMALKNPALTARELADELGLEINTASMRLRKLHQLRLIGRREEFTPEGREYVYALPV